MAGGAVVQVRPPLRLLDFYRLFNLVDVVRMSPSLSGAWSLAHAWEPFIRNLHNSPLPQFSTRAVVSPDRLTESSGRRRSRDTDLGSGVLPPSSPCPWAQDVHTGHGGSFVGTAWRVDPVSNEVTSSHDKDFAEVVSTPGFREIDLYSVAMWRLW